MSLTFTVTNQSELVNLNCNLFLIKIKLEDRKKINNSFIENFNCLSIFDHNNNAN